MTELLFRADAYQTAADCQVIGHTAEGGILVDPLDLLCHQWRAAGR